jgi:hypothetical protein
MLVVPSRSHCRAVRTKKMFLTFNVVIVPSKTRVYSRVEIPAIITQG